VDVFLGFFELLQFGLYSQNFLNVNIFTKITFSIDHTPQITFSIDHTLQITFSIDHTPQIQTDIRNRNNIPLTFRGLYIYADISSLTTDSGYESNTLQGVQTVKLNSLQQRGLLSLFNAAYRLAIRFK
jgi:hypothetical protein